VSRLLPVFDLDGTLLDSDEALVAAFVALGIPRESISFGHVIGDECARLGIDVLDYVDRYDTTIVQPFAGAADLIAQLDRWAVCSNKHPVSGHAELARLGWAPEVALFTDAFDGPKRLEPVLERLGVDAADVVFIGDTAHDRACAASVGAAFALAGWNPRAVAAAGDVVLRAPADVLVLLG
jgi:HAD superfamily hydrolase (TIGR01549 family)